MGKIAQESFNLVLNVEMFQVFNSLSLLASAGNRIVLELLGSSEACFFSSNAFLFNTKSAFICFALFPNRKAGGSRKHKLPSQGAPHS